MQLQPEVSGIVGPDPAVTLPIGAQIRIVARGVQFENIPTPAALEHWGSFNGLLLIVCFSTTTDDSIDGSAVIVAPGIAICALHVVEPKIAEVMAGSVSITCFGFTGTTVQTWRVRRIVTVGSSDLAILVLELACDFPNGGTLFVSGITTRLPKKGENLLLCGFRAAAYSFQRSSPVRFEGNVIVSRGEVGARFLTGRDRCMMPWPCLEVNCFSWGGMSGGPAYDEGGRLVGIVSSSFEEGPSYVSLIWPALITEFQGGWPGPLFQAPTRLINMELCAIDRRDAVDHTQRTYRVWE